MSSMEIDGIAMILAGVGSDSRDQGVDWDERSRLWAELAANATELLVAIIPEAFCTAQEWDNRLDCVVRLADGATVGEMIRIGELTTEWLEETAERLRRRRAGEPVQLVNPLSPPILIRRQPPELDRDGNPIR